MREQIGVTRFALVAVEGLEESGLRRADNLDALAGEILGEPRQRQAGAVNRRLADQPLETVGAGQEFQLQGAGLLSVESLDGDEFALHGAYMLNSGPK